MVQPQWRLTSLPQDLAARYGVLIADNEEFWSPLRRESVMIIARVIGTVVATRKHENLVGSKIQIVQPLDPRTEEPQGGTLVAVDVVGAGVGERVFVVQGSGARLAVGDDKCPVDATIIGIIDELDVQ